MSRKTRRLTFVFLAVLISTCRTAYAADPLTAHVILSPLTGSLDPVSLPRLDESARSVAENLFVGLTRYNPLTGQIEPGLASDWSISSDKLTWTFKLRSDIQWVTYNPASQQVTAVRPVVAGDFVYGIRRACDPTPPNPAAHTVYIIAGCLKVATANPLELSDLFIARELRIQALNDQTLEVKLEFPAPYFATLASLPEFRAVPREAIAKDPDWTKPGTILTDGPWALADWNRDPQNPQTMTLVRNPLWPIKADGNLERVAITFSPYSDTTAKQLIAGTVDFAPLDFSSMALVKAAKPDLVHSAPGQTETVLGFSVERPLVGRDAMRRALSESIDRDSLISQVSPGQLLPMSYFTPPGTIGGPSDPPDNSGFKPNDAPIAFKKAGFGNCKFTDKIGLMVEDQPQSTILVQTLIGQWKTALGCDMSAFNVIKAPASAVQAVAHGSVDTNSPNASPRPELWIYSWTPDYPDANAWMGDALHCQYGYLRTGLACGDAEPLIDAAFLETDQAKRASDYAQAETIWFGPNGTFPVAPLFISISSVGQQPWLTRATVNGPIRFDQWMLSAH